MSLHTIPVSLVYALPEQQWIFETTVERGTSAQELVVLSGFLNEIENLVGKSVDDLSLGCFAQSIRADYLLQKGDRIEIYRALKADPKDVRRELAKLGKVMGSR